MARREENPRVMGDSRWLAYRQGMYVVLKQNGLAWDTKAQHVVFYRFKIEETGEEIEVEAPKVYQTINAKKMIDIGWHNKADILKGKF